MAFAQIFFKHIKSHVSAKIYIGDYMTVSLIIPAYNEEKIIAHTLKECLNYMSLHFSDYEIIVVNDGSLDNTEKIVRSFSKVICVSYAKNQGKGYALKRGVLRSTGDYVFFMDADLSFPLSNINLALERLKTSNASAILGTRLNRQKAYPLHRRIFSGCFHFIASSVLGENIEDIQCGFKGFTKDIGREFFSLSQVSGFCIDLELLQFLKIRHKSVVFLPTNFSHRQDSKIKLFTDSPKMLWELTRLMFKRSYYDHPSL